MIISNNYPKKHPTMRPCVSYLPLQTFLWQKKEEIFNFFLKYNMKLSATVETKMALEHESAFIERDL
jgi:hypothetical protein